MVGVPARQKGWMSRHGHLLKEPDAAGIMTCPESGLRYQLGKAGDKSVDKPGKAVDRGSLIGDKQGKAVDEPVKAVDRGSWIEEPVSAEQRSTNQDPRSTIHDPRSTTNVTRSTTNGSRSTEVLRCLDLDEDAPLPPEMAVGKAFYDELKRP
jgi:hypothetical protein